MRLQGEQALRQARLWLGLTPTPTPTLTLASKVSKLFVALAVLRLVTRGAIGLADHVAAGGVTLEHVLAHTAGHLETLYPAVTSWLGFGLGLANPKPNPNRIPSPNPNR